MERSLRELIAVNDSEEFRGIYLEGRLNATRKNVLVPGSLGVYTGGSNYNPAQVLRDESTRQNTQRIDQILKSVPDQSYIDLPVEQVQELIRLTAPDDSQSERVWDPIAISESIAQYAKIASQTACYVYVDRDRDLQKSRLETAGVLTGGEGGKVPRTHMTLFMLRTKANPNHEPSWWPQVRFPNGRYAFAFSI